MEGINIDKETFKKTEGKLYRYFEKDRVLNSYKSKIELLNKQVEDIENKIKNIDIDIPIESRSIAFEERVQTSSDGTSYAERMAIKITDDLLKEKTYKKLQINDLEAKIREIQTDNEIIDFNIKDINKELKELIELKYKQKLKNWEIAQRMNVSEATATRIKERVIRVVSSWEDTLMYKAYENVKEK